jgi:large subunit ribosomal protein L30
LATKLKVTLKKSGIGRPRTQKDTLRGMGLTRIRKTVFLPNTPSFRGMVKKVIHLVEVCEVETEEGARPASDRTIDSAPQGRDLGSSQS